MQTPPPHALKLTVLLPAAVTTTDSPASGVTPSPARILMANGVAEAIPVVCDAAGALLSCMVFAAAEKVALTELDAEAN